MRFSYFFFLLFLSANAFAQNDSAGVIRVRKNGAKRDTLTAVPDTGRPQVLLPRGHCVWLHAEGLRGVERSGQAFWPVNIDESKLLLRRAWGLALMHKRAFPVIPRQRIEAEASLRSGISFFQTHAEKRSAGIPLIAGLAVYRYGFFGLSGEIGARHFAKSADPALAGRTLLETAFGLSFDFWIHWGAGGSFRTMLYFQHRQIGPHRFASIGMDAPLIRQRRARFAPL